MSEQKFTTTVRKDGTKIVLPIPFNPDERWGEKPRHQVNGSINGHAIRGSLVLNGSSYILVPGPAWLRENPLPEGTVVEVTLAPEGPQMDTLPIDLMSALVAEPQAKTFFESLSTFYRKGYVNWVQSNRDPAIRSARIAEVIRLLKAGKKERDK